MKNNKQKTLALALGGGSALGFAHVGFLQVLEEAGIVVHAIAGTSMGALVGGFYAYGFNAQELETFATKSFKSYKFVGDVQAVRGYKKGFVSGKRIEKYFNKFLENKEIKELKVPFKAVCADMISGKLYNYEKGLVSSAIRASISLPTIFTPVEKDNMILVDGGLVDNVPVASAREFKTEVVIGVDVLGDYHVKNQELKMSQVIALSFFALLKQNKRSSGDDADYLVKMNLNEGSVISYNTKSIKKLIAEGREIAKEHIEEIKKLVY